MRLRFTESLLVLFKRNIRNWNLQKKTPMWNPQTAARCGKHCTLPHPLTPHKRIVCCLMLTWQVPLSPQLYPTSLFSSTLADWTAPTGWTPPGSTPPRTRSSPPNHPARNSAHTLHPPFFQTKPRPRGRLLQFFPVRPGCRVRPYSQILRPCYYYSRKV